MARKVVVIVDGKGLLVEAAGILDILERANRALPETSRLEPYEWTLAAPGSDKIIAGSSGLRLLVDANLAELEPRGPWDTVVIAGGGSEIGSDRRREISAWVRSAEPSTRRVASVCAGAFALADAGLLDGKRATTHWRRADELRRRFPAIDVDADPIFIREGKISTSAGATSGFDLVLSFVEEDLGEEIARDVARNLVIYLRRPGGQSQFSAPLERSARGDCRIRELQLWAMEHLEEDLRVEALAERAAMSPRNFARVFRAEVGVPPAAYVEELRVEAARRRLERTDDTMEGIAAACGLGTAGSVRRAFRRVLGVSPGEYRARFGRN